RYSTLRPGLCASGMTFTIGNSSSAGRKAIGSLTIVWLKDAIRAANTKLILPPLRFRTKEPDRFDAELIRAQLPDEPIEMKERASGAQWTLLMHFSSNMSPWSK